MKNVKMLNIFLCVSVRKHQTGNITSKSLSINRKFLILKNFNTRNYVAQLST